MSVLRKRGFLPAIVAGAMFAVVGGYYLGRTETTGAAEEARSSSPPLEGRAVLGSREGLLAAAHAAPRGDAGPPEDELFAELLRIASEKRAAHAAEGRDEGWATSMERSVVEAFASSPLDRLEARLEEVDCRSSRCVATLRWSSVSVALSEIRRVSHANLEHGSRCAQGAVALPHLSSETEVHGYLFLECSRGPGLR